MKQSDARTRSRAETPQTGTGSARTGNRATQGI